MTQSPAEPRWDEPQLGARIYRVVLLQFEAEFGRKTLEDVFRQHLPLSLQWAEDVTNFASLAFVERLLDVLVEAAGDDAFLERAARAQFSPSANGFMFYLAQSLGNPGFVYRKSSELSAGYNRVGAFQVNQTSPQSAVLTYRSSVPERSRRFCQLRKINYAVIPCIWGLPDAQVTETECLHTGGSCCRYELTWQNPVRAWGIMLGAGVGAALAGAGLLIAGPSPWWMSIFLLGVAAGAWVEATSRNRRQDALIDEQRRGMERSLLDLEHRANELHRANVELDQRVADRTQELSTALEKLQQLDALKTEFFANVSHELRTPLTLILTPVEDRLGKEIGAEERRLLEGLRRNAQRLLRLIDDLLDLTRIDAGQLRLDIGPIDAGALVRQLKTLFDSAARARSVALLVEGVESTTDLWGDAHRLDSVLSNLLGNALKFTPSGGSVTLLVNESGQEVSVTVRDTGPGIAPDDLPRIFDRYYQASEPTGRRRGGVGIGLALAKNLVELHGGRIGVQSDPGYGATFTVVVPKGRAHFRAEVLERRHAQVDPHAPRRRTDEPAASFTPPMAAPLPPRPSSPPVAFEGKRKPRVLVVEDNPDVRTLLLELLSPHFEVSVAIDGQAGLEAVTKDRPDLVLSDVMMPRMSGTELCAALKRDPALAHIPVVLLTARGGTDAAVEGLSSGADEFVEKPFHPRVLVARVEAQLRIRSLSLQLNAQSRLAAVGTLAAGVGHEVRNPVNAVLNGVRALQGRAGLDGSDQRLLEVIADGAERINRISGALLAHASPGDRGGSRPVDVREGLDSTLRLMAHRLGEVAVHRDYASTAMVVAPAAELNQIFVNLIDNGLRTSAKNLWLSVTEVGSTLHISVADDGPGVPPDVAPRLFDAFYTTRAAGEGTGLGLYLSKQSVLRWGGDLTFAPRPGGGTTFTVALPKES